MNDKIFFFFYNLAHQNAFFDGLAVFLAAIFPYIVVLLAGMFILMHHEVFKADSTWQIFVEKRKEILGAFFAGALAWALSKMLKFFIHTNRPFVEFPNIESLIPEVGFSFPSSHASFFMALAVAIFLFHRKAGSVFIFFALLIGLARIVAGVHFPIDIIGGFVLGAVAAYFLKKIFPHT